MSELLTAAQMRAIEQAAIESGEVTGLELMERAGQGVVEAIFEEWPELGGVTADSDRASDTKSNASSKKRAVVLCGPGNNGGDGFVVARLLHQLGWAVEVFLYGDAEKLPPNARVNYERWSKLGDVHDLLSEYETWPESLWQIGARCEGVIVDALFGTGLSRPLDRSVRQRLSDFRCMVPLSFLPFVCVDVPSGLCSDSGRYLAPKGEKPMSFHTELCVTFHRAKVGHFSADLMSDRVSMKPIGLDEIHQQQNAARLSRLTAELSDILSSAHDPASLRSALLAPSSENTEWFEHKMDEYGPVELVQTASEELLKLSGHKFVHGHALVMTGGSGKTGAARLAARGALRIGAGLVTLGVPPNAQQEVACQITALMLQRVADGVALEAVLGDTRLNALCLGPGMGQERARELVPVALAAKRATVLDADALSAFEHTPEALFEMLHDACVLTPHGGEFARLFPDIAAKLAETPSKGPAYSKVDATREAAARAGCVVLFKGPDTVIAAPDGRCAVNAAVYDRAAPWLATAGSGDVLAGFITGLLARGFEPQTAAETAAWLHVECARAFGPGLIAEDLPEILPQVLRNLNTS